MSHKRLSQEQIEQVKQMAINGVAPQDIANHFEVAISTIHNYKKTFEQAGVVMPNLRGTRPRGFVGESPNENDETNTPAIVGKLTATGSSVYRFTLNGTRINISGDAKEINVTKEGVEINY